MHGMPDRSARRTRIAPFLVVAGCLLTQLVVLVEQHINDPTFYVPIVDAADYHVAAVRLAAGARLIDDAFWQPPMFPLLLGCLYSVVGESILIAKLVMAVIGAGSGLLLWWIGSRLFSPRVGLIAGLALSVYGPFLFFNSQLLPTGLAVFLNLVALALWLRCLEKPKWDRWLLLGFLIGAAIITVPNSGVLWIVVICVLLLSKGGRRQPTTALAAACLLTLGATVPVGLVTARNYMVAGELVVLSTNGGINFFIGNNPQSDRTVAIRPGAEWKRLARQSFGSEIPTRAEQSTHFLRRGLDYSTDDPLDFLAGLGRKAIRVVNAREIPRNVDPYLHRDFSWMLSALMCRAPMFAFPFGLLAPLALLGAVVSLRPSSGESPQRRGRLGLLAFVTLYGASVVFFFVSSRYRLPVAVAMIPFAAAGVDWIWFRAVRRRQEHTASASEERNGRLVSGLLIVLVAAATLLVNQPIRVPTDGVNFRTELLTAVGQAYAQQGNLNRAEDHLRRANEADPSDPAAACRLAVVLGRQGDLEEAEQILSSGPHMRSATAELHETLGALLQHLERVAEAEESYRTALSIDPTSPQAHAGLAGVLAEAGNIDGAIVHYRAAIRFTSESGEMLIRLADLLAKKGTYEEAIECYRLALRKIEPEPATLNAIAWLLATCPVVELRDCQQAISLAEHLCEITQYKQPVALDTLAAAYAECDRIEEALQWVRRAIDIAESLGDHAAVASFRQRSHLYQQRLNARPIPTPPVPQP